MVITMEIYKQIRKMRLDGMSQRQIAATLHISRNTVKKYWDSDSVPWERKDYSREASVLTEDVVAFVKRCLDEDRNFTTTSGDVTLHVPRLKGVSFETAIIERYRRRESSVEEALIEMYLAGVSVRRVEDITEALWGSKVSPATISELNKKAYVHIEDWRNRPLQGGKYPYVYVDGIYLRRNWGGEYENVAILVAIAVNEDGYREVLGAAEGMKEDKGKLGEFLSVAQRSRTGRRKTHCWR